MSTITELFADLNGGLVHLKTEHVELAANVLRTDGTPGPDVFMITEAGADFILQTLEGRAYFKVLDEVLPWHFPVGSDEYPIEKWYIATVHDLTGARNSGYKHSGIDYNVEVAPRGDVDRGQPVWAVAGGEIYGTWHTERNLASVVIKVYHDDVPLYVRYWHLAQDATFLNLRPGLEIEAGRCLGHLGSYAPGGAHLHFDMALDAFHPGCWLVSGVRWIAPVAVLKAHLAPNIVDASLRIG